MIRFNRKPKSISMHFSAQAKLRFSITVLKLSLIELNIIVVYRSIKLLFCMLSLSFLHVFRNSNNNYYSSLTIVVFLIPTNSYCVVVHSIWGSQRFSNERQSSWKWRQKIEIWVMAHHTFNVQWTLPHSKSKKITTTTKVKLIKKNRRTEAYQN